MVMRRNTFTQTAMACLWALLLILSSSSTRIVGVTAQQPKQPGESNGSSCNLCGQEGWIITSPNNLARIPTQTVRTCRYYMISNEAGEIVGGECTALQAFLPSMCDCEPVADLANGDEEADSTPGAPDIQVEVPAVAPTGPAAGGGGGGSGPSPTAIPAVEETEGPTAAATPIETEGETEESTEPPPPTTTTDDDDKEVMVTDDDEGGEEAEVTDDKATTDDAPAATDDDEPATDDKAVADDVVPVADDDKAVDDEVADDKVVTDDEALTDDKVIDDDKEEGGEAEVTVDDDKEAADDDKEEVTDDEEVDDDGEDEEVKDDDEEEVSDDDDDEVDGTEEEDDDDSPTLVVETSTDTDDEDDDAPTVLVASGLVEDLEMKLYGISSLKLSERAVWVNITETYIRDYYNLPKPASFVTNVKTTIAVTSVKAFTAADEDKEEDDDERRRRVLRRRQLQTTNEVQGVLVTYAQQMDYRTTDPDFSIEKAVTTPFLNDMGSSSSGPYLFVLARMVPSTSILASITGMQFLVEEDSDDDSSDDGKDKNNKNTETAIMVTVAVVVASLLFLILLYCFFRTGDDDEKGEEDEGRRAAAKKKKKQKQSKDDNKSGTTLFGSNDVNSPSEGALIVAPSGDESFATLEYEHLKDTSKINIYAPSGKLGVVIDTPHKNGGAPVVVIVKETSVLSSKIRVGDRLMSVDDQDVSRMTAIAVSKLISDRSRNATRKLTVLRKRK